MNIKMKNKKKQKETFSIEIDYESTMEKDNEKGLENKSMNIMDNY